MISVQLFNLLLLIPPPMVVINDQQDRLSSDVLSLFKLDVFVAKVDYNYTNKDIEAVEQLGNNYKLLTANTSLSVITNEYRL